MSTDLLRKIDEILENDIVSRHSFFQLQHFVVNKEPTIQSRMWQCIRELRTRRDAIEKIQFEIEETKDNLMLAEIEIKKIDLNNDEVCKAEGKFEELVRESREIQKRQLSRRKDATEKSLIELRRRLIEQIEEAQFFVKSVEALQKIEELKPFDDPQSQRDYWNERLTQELNVRLLLRHPIDTELAKTIFALNEDAPIKKQLINIMEQFKTLEITHKPKVNKLEKS